MNSTEFAEIAVGPNATRPPEIYRFVPGRIPKPQWDLASPAPTGKTFNGTGFYIEDDAEIGYNDLQTLFLACFATITPLVLTVVAGFGIRVLWRKYIRRKRNKLYADASQTEVSIDSVTQPLHTHLYNNDKQSTETHLTIETDEVCEMATTNSIQIPRTANHSNTNGSIITMTMKNNHLIVETEERNDIEEDSRATKMKYSPSARDGVFVVEVQQGVRRSPGLGNIPLIDEPDRTALIHDPPTKYSEEDELLAESDSCLDYLETTSPVNRQMLHDEPSTLQQTGLTQSDQSLSQFSYTYGNQKEYSENFGYPATILNASGCDTVSKLITKGPQLKNTKPKITSAIFKSVESMRSFELLSDDALLSDIVIPSSKNSSKDDDDSIQEEQNRLGNCAPSLADVSEKSTDQVTEKNPEKCDKG